MYVTKELALQIESCIKQTHILMSKAHPLGKILELEGGAACFAGYSSFFSQVIAWGFHLSVKQFKMHIQSIEQFYHFLNHDRIDIELCSLVGNDLPMALNQRGYILSELNNVSFIDLTDYKIRTDSTSFEIREITSAELEHWAKQVALGFGYTEAREQFAQYARLTEVTAFGVFDKDQIIAGATLAVHNGIADFGVTSTLPAHRGKGLQKLLLKKRLDFAREQDISLAVVTTEPGSISDINIQKIGFHCAYTRLKFTKNL